MMKPKRIVSSVLLLFVAISVVYLVAGESTSRNGSGEANAGGAIAQTEPTKTRTPPSEISMEAKAPKDKVIAYYFHGDYRCHTCLTMERFAHEALDESLSSEMESGRLDWQSVNVDTPGNEHFNMDFGLTSSALVLVDIVNREQKQWKDLQRIWDLVGDESKFKDYVRNEVVAYLENEK